MQVKPKGKTPKRNQKALKTHIERNPNRLKAQITDSKRGAETREGDGDEHTTQEQWWHTLQQVWPWLTTTISIL